MTTIPENAKVGEYRTFTGNTTRYQIREILHDSNIKMLWSWTSGFDLKTKQRIPRERIHTFKRIEILGDETIATENLTAQNILILGDDNGGRKLLLTEDKYDEVFTKSSSFKHLIGTQVNPQQEIKVMGVKHPNLIKKEQEEASKEENRK